VEQAPCWALERQERKLLASFERKVIGDDLADIGIKEGFRGVLREQAQFVKELADELL
jgi:hypothetical protein